MNMQIKVGKRFRKDLGDLSSLKKSIQEVGLLHPIVIDSDGNLIAGERRLQACKELGIDPPFTVIDVTNPIQAEFDENRERVDFTYSEIYEIGEYINQTESRQGTNQYKEKSFCINDTEAKNPRDKVAKITGLGTATISKINTIWKSGNNELKQKVDDKKVSVDKAYKEVKREEKKQEREQIIKTNAPLYKNTELITLIEGDIFDVIHEVQDKSINCLCVDPPYHVMEDYDWDKQEIDFLDRWIMAVKPKLKNEYTGFIFCDARMIYEFETVIKNHFDIKNRLIWIRKNMANGRVIKSKFISSYEVIFYFGNKDLNLPEDWGSERFDSFEYAVPQSNFSEGKFHPTQKPIELIKRLIGVGTHEGESVLDCFAGSGTTGIACKELNRKCTLIEREPEYINTIKGRLL